MHNSDSHLPIDPHHFAEVSVVQIVSLNSHPRGRTERAYLHEFAHYLHQRRQPTHPLAADTPTRIARLAYRAGGRFGDWLLPNPAELLRVALPRVWTLPACDRATELLLAFNTFLVASGRQRPDEGAFMEGWIRAAQAGVLRALLIQGEAVGRRRRPLEPRAANQNSTMAPPAQTNATSPPQRVTEISTPHSQKPGGPRTASRESRPDPHPPDQAS